MSHMRCRMIAAQASAESAKSLEIRAKYAANPRVQQPVQPVGRHCWCAMRRAVGNWIWLRFVKSWIWRVLLWEIGVLRGDFAKHNLETGTFPSTTRSILGVSEWFHGSESTRPTTIRITIFPTANLFGFNLWAGDWWEENAGAEKPEPCWNLPGTLPEPRYLPGTVLQRCWKFVGTFLEPSCWNCAGTFLEPLWNLLEPCWNCVRTVLELCWNYPGTFLELSWNFAGTSLEPCWNFCVSALVTVPIVVVLSPKTSLEFYYLFFFGFVVCFVSSPFFDATLCLKTRVEWGKSGISPADWHPQVKTSLWAYLSWFLHWWMILDIATATLEGKMRWALAVNCLSCKKSLRFGLSQLVFFDFDPQLRDDPWSEVSCLWLWLGFSVKHSGRYPNWDQLLLSFQSDFRATA